MKPYSTRLPELVVFRNTVDQSEHLAIIKGADFAENVVDVRVHNQKLLADVFGARDDTGPGFRLGYGLDMLDKSDRGVLIYLTQPSQSFAKEIKALAQKQKKTEKSSGLAAGEMDVRMHGTGAQMIRALGVKKMRIHTTSKLALKGLSGFGLEIVEEQIFPNR